MKRPEKKSESLEIRLPYSQKQAFMEACRERGVTASDTLRQFIAADLDAQDAPPGSKTWTARVRNNPFKTAAGAAGAALAAAALGASPSFADDQVFDRFDGNADGIVSYAEFMDQLSAAAGNGGVSISELGMEIRNAAPDTDTLAVPPAPPGTPPQPTEAYESLFRKLDQDHSGGLTPKEFEGDGRIVRRTDELIDVNGSKGRMVGLEVTTYDVTDKGSISVGRSALSKIIDADASDRELEKAYAELEDEILEMESNRPTPPAPPRVPTR
ncbi:MAG: hypothetical protein AAF830_15175 [Pseudomonadota bacterium]